MPKKINSYRKSCSKINANRAFAKAYNTGDLIAINSASAGININMELNRKNSAEIEKSKILYQKSVNIPVFF